MASLGSYLSGLRAARDVSLEEMAKATRVSQRYLEALEADDHAELPAPVFTRGFVRAYCQALDQPCDEALRRYAEQTGEKPVVAHRVDPIRGVDRHGGARSAVFVSLVLLVVLGVTLFALTFVLQGSREASEPRATTEAKPAAAPETVEPPRAAPRAPDPAAAPPVPAVASPPPAVPATHASDPPVAPATAASTSPYRLVARATEKTWVRVLTEDGRAVAEEVIPAGERREWLSNRRFILTIGNAGGIDLELNGQLLPRLGPSGEVVRQLLIPAEER